MNPKGNFSSEKFPESSPDVGTTHPVSGSIIRLALYYLERL